MFTNIDHRYLLNPVHAAITFAAILAVIPKITSTIVAVEKFCKWFKKIWGGDQKKKNTSGVGSEDSNVPVNLGAFVNDSVDGGLTTYRIVVDNELAVF